MIIGITGGTGSGKTTALDAIRQLGGLVIDCDAVYHELLKTDSNMLSAIEERFPGTVENGTLQRKKLGSQVFSDPQALEDLNRITSQAITARVADLLKGNPKLAAIDAIRLFESGLSRLCDLTVAVVAPEEVRIQRLMERDQVTREYAVSRISAQKPIEFYKKHCDYVLENSGTYEEFQNKCLAFFRNPDIIKEENP